MSSAYPVEESPEVIWLAPKCDDGSEGRTWCSENVWGEACDEPECNSPPVKYVRADLIDGELLGSHVLHHIDTMYPAMWKDVARSARTSIRNLIIRFLDR